MSDVVPPSHPSSTVNGITRTHGDIIAHLFDLAGLSTSAPLDAAARALAERAIDFFDRTMLAHHGAEEQHLFPTVLALAIDGAEREYVQALVSQLTEEHRKIEALWTELAQRLRLLIQGGTSPATDERIQRLVLDYGDHATREESELLPLCHAILQRASDGKHSQALLAMHRGASD